eukprot:scaffold240678_cov75-Attheya_sp.AAC.1
MSCLACVGAHRLHKDVTATRENQGPGPTSRDQARVTEPELLGAGNGRQAPITKKKCFDHEEGIVDADFSWHAAILGLNSNFFQ